MDREAWWPTVHGVTKNLISNTTKSFPINKSVFRSPSMKMLEKAMATYSSNLAGQVPRMEEPGRLQAMGSLGVRQD